MPVSRGGIVSLVPSITETLLGWGVTPVAVTRFCEVPGIPTVGGTKNPDIEAIVGMGPDIVLMDAEENRRPDAESIEQAGIRVVATDVRHVDGVPAALLQIAEAAGIEPRGKEPEIIPVRPLTSPVKVFVPIWKRPWMTVSGSTYGSSLLHAAGLENIFSDADNPYPEVSLDVIRDHRPDFVLAPSEPYPFAERHRAALEEIAPAVFVDGRDLFWWGIRTPGAIERIRGLAVSLSGG